MNISIISTSHQQGSQSNRVSEILKTFLLQIDKKVKCFNIDVLNSNVPLWTSNKKENLKPIGPKDFLKINLDNSSMKTKNRSKDIK